MWFDCSRIVGKQLSRFIALAVCRVLLAASWQTHSCGEASCCPQRDSEAVYLTYDDGPCYPHTYDLADALTAEGVSATFYAQGYKLSRIKPSPPWIYRWNSFDATEDPPSWAADSEMQLSRLRRMLDNGHLLAHHTMDHTNLSKSGVAEDPKSLGMQLNETKRMMEDLVARTGSTRLSKPSAWKNRHFRPPYGELSKGSRADAWVKDLFDLTAWWDINTYDWDTKRVLDVETVLRIIDARWKSGKAGHIILMHECMNENATGINASLRIVRHLKKKCPKCIFPNMDHCLDLHLAQKHSHALVDGCSAAYRVVVAGITLALSSMF